MALTSFFRVELPGIEPDETTLETSPELGKQKTVQLPKLRAELGIYENVLDDPTRHERAHVHPIGRIDYGTRRETAEYYSLMKALITALMTCVALAAPAHADDQSYIRYLNDNGIAIGVNSPAIQLQAGRMVCDNLRAGADPRAGMNVFDRALVPDPAVDAAQHQLCPDTLGR